MALSDFGATARTYTDVSPTKGEVHIYLDSIKYAYQSTVDISAAWSIIDYNQFHCVWFDGATISLETVNPTFVVTTHDTYIYPGSTNGYMEGDMEIIIAGGDFFVYFDDNDNTDGPQLILRGYDNSHSVFYPTGFVYPFSGVTEVFVDTGDPTTDKFLDIGRYVVSDTRLANRADLSATASITASGTVLGGAEGSLVSLAATATVTAAGTVTPAKEGAVSLSAAASLSAAGTTSLAVLAHYRWRNDDGDETTATWLEPVDTPASVSLDTMYRLRIAIENTALLTSTVFNKRGLEVSVNGAPYVAAASVHGATSCCETSFVLDQTVDLTFFGDGETQARSPNLFVTTNGDWHLFYISYDGNWRLRYRRSIDGGASWAAYQTIPTTLDGNWDAVGYGINRSRLLVQANGNLVFMPLFHANETFGIGIRGTHTTEPFVSNNGGTSWTAKGNVTWEVFSEHYWDSWIDANDTLWVTVTTTATYTSSLISIATYASDDEGSTWVTQTPYNNDYDIENVWNTFCVSDNTNTGVYNHLYEDYSNDSGAYFEWDQVSIHHWDGIGTNVYTTINLHAWESNAAELENSGFFFSSPEANSAYIPVTLVRMDFSGSSQIWAVTTMGSDQLYANGITYTPSVWGVSDSAWKYQWATFTYGFGQHTTKSGLVIFQTHNDTINSVFGVAGYDDAPNNMFIDSFASTSRPLFWGGVYDMPGARMHVDKTTNIIYTCNVPTSINTDIRIAHLSAENDSLVFRASDDGNHLTQQISSGAFVSNNYGLSLFGTAGAKDITLPAQSTTELEYYIKLNSAILTNSDIVCFRVAGSDEGEFCIVLAAEEVKLKATASITATGSVDGPKIALTASASITASGSYVHYGKASLLATATLSGVTHLTKLGKATLLSTATVIPHPTVPRNGAVSLLAKATIETNSINTVRGACSLHATANVVFAEPVVLVRCKASLRGTSKITPHGSRIRQAKISLLGIAKLGKLNKGIIGTVDELGLCLSLYKKEEKLEINKRKDLIIVREDSLVLSKTSEAELIIVKETKELTTVVVKD